MIIPPYTKKDSLITLFHYSFVSLSARIAEGIGELKSLWSFLVSFLDFWFYLILTKHVRRYRYIEYYFISRVNNAIKIIEGAIK